MKKIIFSLFGVILFNICFSQSSIKLTANYETIGITVLLDENDPEKDAYAKLHYKATSGSDWKAALDLARVDNDLDLIAGALFWLEAGKSYDVEVTVIDPSTSGLDGQVMAGTISTKIEPSIVVGNGITFPVNPTGINGSYTLVEAIQLAEAGDQILLDSGTYFVGNLSFPNNGSVDNPILVRGVDRDQVFLDGGHEEPLTWTPYGAGGVYQSTTAVINPNLVIADGIRLYPHQTFPDLQKNLITLSYLPLREYPSEVSGFYRNPTLLPLANFGDPSGINKNKIYVKFLDNSDPNDKDIAVTKQATCFKLENNSHITLQNLTFQHYGLGHIATAIVISDSDHITIDSCSFFANNTGIKLAADSEHILIQNSFFKDYFFNWNAWKIKATQDGGTLFDARFPYLSRNLEKGSLVYGHDFVGNNIVFRSNTISDYHQGGMITTAPPSTSDLNTMRKSLDIDFYDNTISNCRGDGFELEGIVRNVRVFRNHFTECHAPLSLAIAEQGPVYILRNTFNNIIRDSYDNGFDLTETKGHSMKFQGGNGNEVNGNIYVYHNTIDAQNEAYAMNVYQVTIPDIWKKLDCRNNIYATDMGISLQVRTLSEIPTYTSDYNAFSSNNPDITCVTFDNSSPDCYTLIEDVFTEYGWEENSLQADPEFVDIENSDYRLSGASQLIDAGQIIPGINDGQYSGLKPDMGAFEYIEPIATKEDKVFRLSVYPNPSSSIVQVVIPENAQFISYSLMDMNGKLIYDMPITSRTFEVDLSSLVSGLYTIHLYGKNSSQHVKIIKI